MFQIPPQVIGVSDGLKGQLEQFFARIANDGAEFVVDSKPTAVDSDMGNAHRRLLEGGPVDLLTLLQNQVRTFPGERIREDLCDQF